jgi:hypothetical protein
MPVESASTRRDPRYRLREGEGKVIFSLDSGEDGIYFGDLVQISPGGVGFQVTSGPRMTSGTFINGATITIGTCEIECDLSVIQCQRGPNLRIEVGCMIYPSSKESEEKWIAVIAGMAAANVE